MKKITNDFIININEVKEQLNIKEENISNILEEIKAILNLRYIRNLDGDEYLCSKSLSDMMILPL